MSQPGGERELPAPLNLSDDGGQAALMAAAHALLRLPLAHGAALHGDAALQHSNVANTPPMLHGDAAGRTSAFQPVTQHQGMPQSVIMSGGSVTTASSRSDGPKTNMVATTAAGDFAPGTADPFRVEQYLNTCTDESGILSPNSGGAHRNADTSATFDQGAMLCQVCGDRASGFHYGVHACEGCKGFFRRSIQQKLNYRPCAKDQQCSILRINRNRCQYCRLKKCIAVGMSRDAVRFGRVPKKEKEKIRQEMQRANWRCVADAMAAELDNDAKVVAAVVAGHMRTCHFTNEKLSATLHGLFSLNGAGMPAAVACPLSPSSSGSDGNGSFAERYSPAIRGVVDFAKSIPGFHHLPLDDQATLLKAGMFEVLLLRLCVLFDTEHKAVTLLDGRTYRRDTVPHNQASGVSKFLVDSTFDFIERFKKLCLNDMDIALYCAVILVSPDRPGIRQTDLVSQLSDRLHACLQCVLAANHPNQRDLYPTLAARLPDLRTLNTLHQEKLLAFTLPQNPIAQNQAQASGSPSSGSTHSPTWPDSLPCDDQQTGQQAAQTNGNVPNLQQLHLSPSSDSGRGTISAQNSLFSQMDDVNGNINGMSTSIRQCMPTLARALQAPPIISLQQLHQACGVKGINPMLSMMPSVGHYTQQNHQSVPVSQYGQFFNVKMEPGVSLSEGHQISTQQPAMTEQSDQLQPLNLSTKQSSTAVYVGTM